MSRPVTDNPRRQQLNLSLTDREFADIRQRAEAFGMRPVHFARALVIDGAPVMRNVAARYTSRLHLQLSRIGNNLNQLVRALHRTGVVVPEDLEPLLADIRKLMARMQE